MSENTDTDAAIESSTARHGTAQHGTAQHSTHAAGTWSWCHIELPLSLCHCTMSAHMMAPGTDSQQLHRDKASLHGLHGR